MNQVLLSKANQTATFLARKHNDYPNLTAADRAILETLYEEITKLKARVYHLEHGGQMDE